VHHASGIRVGYCDSDLLSEVVSSAGSTATALEFLCRQYPQKQEKDIRAHLTGFGLSPSSQGKTPVCCLSGGETFRFVLAKVMMDNPPVLFVENPTSSLDVESVQALAHGLREWNGTLVMVSQDASFCRSMDVKCFVVVPEEGKLRRIVDNGADGGGMDAYLKTLKLY
jgi:ATPase subunit of ABC transporter with duplicated ATPase domains